ncbi:MAG TPA: NAD(P)H-dependent glycerol-3-phosphate dehydrogenase [Bryobacteraceae bacterium]|nr:NAD(P)H-dependent glycerol-3-phosphate dehydrogenase [Bryobacteraceae bacterium]
MTRLCILGAGSWGTALAIALAPRFESIALWARDPERAAAIQGCRQNERYLKGFALPDNVRVSAHLGCARDADLMLTVIPSQHLRHVLVELAPHCPRDLKIVSATKGIEEARLRRMSEVIAETLPSRPVAVLSGPTFAKEVAAGEPAAVVIASEDLEFAAQVQRAFATRALRLYASSDVIGVEVGAALKNVIAIGAGICRGLGLGSNSVAALVTRGLAEITRLAIAMGGNARTLSGLAGLGDLVLTATGDLSRNRFVGIQLGRGQPLPQILAGMRMIAEGVGTCQAAYALGQRMKVDLPIIQKMHEILYDGKEPRQAIGELMERPLTIE